jgi:hypothetical protein
MLWVFLAVLGSGCAGIFESAHRIMGIWSHSHTQASIPATVLPPKIICDDFCKSYKEMLSDPKKKQHHLIPLFGSWNSRGEGHHTITFSQIIPYIRLGQAEDGTKLWDQKIADIYMQELGVKGWSEEGPEPSHTQVNTLQKWNKSLHHEVLKMLAVFGVSTA